MPSPESRQPLRPLLVGDPDRLANKLQSASGLLGNYWKDFRNSYLLPTSPVSEMSFLSILVERSPHPGVSGEIQAFWEKLSNSDCAGDVQFHTWCRCGAVIRHAFFFDWVACKGGWSGKDLESAAEAFVGFAFKHAFPTLQARCRTSNNQVLAMALCCAVVGSIFGWRHAAHPTAKFLYEYGLGRIPDFLGLFPADGYGGEGSTYTSHVNTPLACWIAAFLEDVTGRSWWDEPFRPNGTTLRRIVEMEWHLISPGGLLPPWDHYGWQKAVNASPFAFLAGQLERPEFLSAIPRFDLWREGGMLAWGKDDPLWTLIWWPEQFREFEELPLPKDFFGWFLPKTGAALDDPLLCSRLMQVWDLTADTIAHVGRMHANPNHLMFELGGEPVFLDGVAVHGKDPWNFSVGDVLSTLTAGERSLYEDYARSSGNGTSYFQNLIPGLSAGLIGASNAVIVDGEDWFWPGETFVGNPLHYHRDDTTQAVSADATKFYSSRYDVTKAQRTSIWSSAGFGVVHDLLEAESTHSWTWQVHLPATAQRNSGTARVPLRNGLSVTLSWLPVERECLEHLDGFPLIDMEGIPSTSSKLKLEKSGNCAEFLFLIAPNAQEASIRSCGEFQWEVVIDGKSHIVQRPGPLIPRTGQADVFELSDIERDYDPQFPEFEALNWCVRPYPPANSGLAGLDYCFSQIGGDHASLLNALEQGDWPVQLAAVDVIGRNPFPEASRFLLSALIKEQELPAEELYPAGTAHGEDAAKRWRLKMALIIALGRCREEAAVPVFKTILSESKDFYPVYSAVAQALGRIGSPDAMASLDLALQHSEDNTKRRALNAGIAIISRS